MPVVQSLVTVWVLVGASVAFQWATTPKDGDIIYACVGDDVTFPWSFTVPPGEGITSAEWWSPQEMMAKLAHGVFVPLPAFSGRVQQTANGSVILNHVTAGDVGNYTLKVSLLLSPDTVKITLILQVTSGLPTSDGHLHVYQQENAVQDRASKQWSLVVSCGFFTFLGQPTFPVELVTPSGHVMSPSAYKDGKFDFHLASPVEGGTYSCRVPEHYAATACLRGNYSTAGRASVAVDKMEARMTLMEAEVRTLRQAKQQLQERVTELTHSVTLQTNLTHHIAQQAADFDDRFRYKMGSFDHRLTVLQTNLTNADFQLRQKLSVQEPSYNKGDSTLTHMTHDTEMPLVGFNAQATFFQTLSAPLHVQFNNVLYNAGQAYDNATGDFSAPLPGVYFFIFHTVPSDSRHAHSKIYAANGQAVCTAYIFQGANHGSCHAVVHLMKGDTVWVEPDGPTRDFTGFTTSFAGFLFHADS